MAKAFGFLEEECFKADLAADLDDSVRESVTAARCARKNFTATG